MFGRSDMECFESIKRKIQKLQAMIDRGESNEIANAQKLLQELLEKYQIDISSITEEKNEWRIFMLQQNLEKDRYYKMIGE